MNRKNLTEIIQVADKLVEESKYQEAISQYNIALSINPDDDILYYKKAMALLSLGSYNTAIYSFSKAIKISPVNPEYYYQYGVALNEMRDYKQAKEMFSMANKLNPAKYPRNGIHYHSLAEENGLQ